MKTLGYFTNNEFSESEAKEFFDIFDPSTGELIAKAPRITLEEMREVIENARKGYEIWSDVPVIKRVRVLFRVRELLNERLEELAILCATEEGKCYGEAKGDILKAIEGTELACSMPITMQGNSLMDASGGYDTVNYRESLGVFAGITPFNFPAMIPMGWMAPACIACGNCIILKLADNTPMTALKICEIYREAGLPDGVLNVVTCDKDVASELLENPAIRGISFVGSTAVGRHIYATAAANGKRVQALCQAKNHALVLEDAPLTRTASGIISASFGCAGERCMALPVVAVQESVADKLVSKIRELASGLKVGPAYDRASKLGPVYSAKHRQKVIEWINRGIAEGAELVLDGRDTVVEGYENGFYVGPTIFDGVTPEMSVGNEEIFGPVLCIKRVENFEEGLKLMNSNPFANGSVIYTRSGRYAREFARRTHAGMVGINVGIPVPVGFFAFCGHKNSFFGDLHTLGKDGYRFYTETKSVTTHWFEADAE